MDLKPRVKPRAIHVRIDRLVLEGVSARDSGAIAAAMRGELHRLLVTHGVPANLARGAALGSVNAGAVPAANGVGIARAVYGGLRR